DAGRATRLHHVARAVPSVEIAHDADALRIRCPHGKARPPHALDGDHMRAELLIDVMMIAFAEEMKVEIGQIVRGHRQAVDRRLWAVARRRLQRCSLPPGYSLQPMVHSLKE